MKTIQSCCIIGALLLHAPIATAETYLGTWFNNTFETTGALTIEFTKTKSKVSGSFDFDGPVFGAGDPPKIDFNAPLDSKGAGKFKINGTTLGDIIGSFTADGKLTMSIVNIPGGFLTEAVINGKFDLKAKTFNATYKIDSTSGPLADGVANAHAPKAPTIKTKRKVEFQGNSAKVKASVVTNTTIKSVKATAKGKAAVSVKGTNPYTIRLKNIKGTKVSLKITVTNGDNLSTTKTVNFTKTSSAAGPMADMVLDAVLP